MLDLTLEAGERIESKLDIDVHEIDTAVAFSFGAFGPALFLVGVACLLRLFCWPRVKRVCARACPSLCHDDAGYRVASELTAADEWAKMIEDNQNPKPPPKEQETPLAEQEEEETTDEEEDDGEEEESEGEEEEESEDEEESEEEEEEPPPPPRWRVKPAPLPKRRVEKPPIKIDPALEEWGRRSLLRSQSSPRGSRLGLRQPREFCSRAGRPRRRRSRPRRRRHQTSRSTRTLFCVLFDLENSGARHGAAF